MKTNKILGVQFLSGSPAEVVEAGLRGGLVVVPSAPVLVDMADKPALLEAVTGADSAITDSGLMVLLWWLLKGEKLERVSGLEYLKLLLERLRAQPQLSDDSCLLSGSDHLPTTDITQPITENASGVFWVMPTVAARDKNLAWLRSQGFTTTEDDCYVAPMYAPDGPISDQQLTAIIQQRKPAHIILALGGGVQERVGYALRDALRTPRLLDESYGLLASIPINKEPITNNRPTYRPGIHCIGAAIGFLSGEQVRIPMWVDTIYLGWLWRSVSAPRRFVPRYCKALRLVTLMLRYRENPPVPKG